MKTKTITLIECTYVLHEYPAKVEISVEDFKKLETGKMNMETIINQYDIKYEGYSEPLYDFSNFDSYKYEGEVV